MFTNAKGLNRQTLFLTFALFANSIYATTPDPNFPIIVTQFANINNYYWSDLIEVLPAEVKLLESTSICSEGITPDCPKAYLNVKLQVVMPSCAYYLQSLSGHAIENKTKKTVELYVHGLVAKRLGKNTSFFKNSFSTDCDHDTFQFDLEDMHGKVILYSLEINNTQE